MTRSPLILRWFPGCLGPLLLALVTLCASGASSKRVLILDPFGRDVAPFSAVVSSFRATLAREIGERVDIYELPLELARLAEAEGEGPLVAFLEDQVKAHPVDLVVPIGGAGVQFAARHRQRLFPDTPVLAVAVASQMVPAGFLQTNTTLVTQQANLPGIVEDILQLQPRTTNIAVVLGTSALEKFWVEECRREFQPFTNQVKFTWLSDLSADQILKRCATLPPRSFIFHAFFIVDAAGVHYDHNEVLRRLHEVANAPVFTYFASELGLGSIGGRLFQDSQLGVQGARTAIRILRGEQAGRIAVQTMEDTCPTYDWRELRRWGIDESRLPAGSVIQYRQPTLWGVYRWHIAGAVLFCLLQTALIIGLVTNALARKRADQDLRESEARLSLAADAASAGLWRLDLITRSFWLTNKTRELFAFGAEEVVTFDRFLNLIHPEDRELVRRKLQEVLELNGEVQVEYRILQPDGRAQWMYSRGRVHCSGSGQPDYLMGVTVDITAQRRAELEGQRLRVNLAHLTRVNTLGALSGSLAHELNQPLGIILSNAQAAQDLLTQEPPDIAEVQAILADIVKADRRAGEVIERLRALFKGGQVSLQKLSLNAVIEEVLDLIRAELLGRSVTIVRELAPDLPLVMGDRVQLQQLVLNLILNAADAMAANASGTRRIRVQTMAHRECVRVSVRDEGEGLPADAELLFQPLYTTKPQGLGMGLAICRSIIDAHDGRLWAERQPERGAVFHFELPVVDGTGGEGRGTRGEAARRSDSDFNWSAS